MVDVFVHENSPLIWFERTKERVWVLGAASCTRGDKAVDSFDELGAFAFEFALCGIRREEFGGGGRVTAQGFVVAEDQRFDEQADDVPGKGCTSGVDHAHRHL